ncbi:MAG: BsuBI/PstI family type II restriction endonuclease, partial [Oligoflexia bacterium]|nr:BsuBI/PstI family type II restriction endonuclease [Oligoflexia bacterium]
MSKNRKLTQAKEILKALGLPRQQYNDRSAWVFLALAHIRPKDKWQNVKAPLLPTINIMQFIREHYGRDYKPNTRETIRRQTLHQFEQARIVDRNRDNPSRPTNSKDNNYSLNQPVIEVLKRYPNDNWKQKIKEYKNELPKLQKIYERVLDKTKIPIRLPHGKKIKLSPGKHNQLHKDIVYEFCSRFIGNSGMILYIGDTAKSRNEGGKFMILEKEQLKAIGIPPMSHEKLPDLVAYDKKRKRVFLIEAVTSHGPISPKRYIEMEKILKNCKIKKIYVSAFP